MTLVEELCAALRDAIEGYVDCAQYKSEYLTHKHGDLAEIERLKAFLETVEGEIQVNKERLDQLGAMLHSPLVSDRLKAAAEIFRIDSPQPPAPDMTEADIQERLADIRRRLFAPK